MTAHIEKLLGQLEPLKEALAKIGQEYLIQFVCVGHYYQSFSWELEFALQKRGTELGISFWFDVYPMGDIHEELVELRDQITRTKV